LLEIGRQGMDVGEKRLESREAGGVVDGVAGFLRRSAGNGQDRRQ